MVLTSDARQQLQTQQRCLGFRTVLDRSQASCIIVCNPTDPGERNLAVVSLRGGLIMSPGYIGISSTSNRSKVAIAYQRALRLQRFIFVTSAVEKTHRKVVRLLQQVCEEAQEAHQRWRRQLPCPGTQHPEGFQPPCEWRWFTDSPPDRKKVIREGSCQRSGAPE